MELLTWREQEVLGLLARGHTDAEIAKRLSISKRMVETDRFEIKKKLNLRGRADLVRFAVRSGLVTFD